MQENPGFFDRLTNFATNTFQTVLDFDLRKSEIEAQAAKTQPQPSPAFQSANQFDATANQSRVFGLTGTQVALAGAATVGIFLLVKAVK